MRDAIQEAAKNALARRVFPGCAIGVIWRGGEHVIHTVGGHTYEVNARPIATNSLFDVASITKAIPTASLALALAGEGKLSLDTEISRYLPDLENHHGATVRDLLLYRVRGARLSELKDLEPEDMLKYLFARGFDGPPSGRSYTNLPALLLGLIIERVMCTTLNIVSERYFFDPLRMNDTVFYAGVPLARAVPTEIEEWRVVVAGVTHDESAYVLAKSGKIVGHAGLFSTVPDLLSFASMLLECKDPRARAVAEGAEEGLGWQVAQPYFMGELSSDTTFGKTGFTGTSIVVDRQRGLGIVILSNRTYPQRPADAIGENCAINVFRREIADIVFSLH